MKTHWISRQPIKYWALSLSVLGLGACSSTQSGVDASDLSYADLPPEQVETAETPVLAQEAPSDKVRTPDDRSSQAYRLSHFPKIANQPIQKDGYSLNGYVFVRTESDWKDLSKLLYGREDRASLLAEWNAGAEIKPGAVVYYNSPFRPDDTSNLKSFDTDFGMTLVDISVAAGESLSSIAAKVYGSPDAWREIASTNAGTLSSPDVIEIGQSLRLAPSARETAPILAAYVQKIQTEAQAALNKDVPVQAEQVAQAAPSQEEVANTVGATAPPAEAQTDVSFPDQLGLSLTDLGFMFGALIAIAALVVSYTRRRKQMQVQNASNTVFFKKKTGTED